MHTGFLQLRQARAVPRCGLMASHCGGFSCGAQALGPWASVAAARGLQSTGSVVGVHGLSCSRACGTSQTRGRRVSLVLQGGFLTTGPPGKASLSLLLTQKTLGFHSHQKVPFKPMFTRSNIIFTKQMFVVCMFGDAIIMFPGGWRGIS